jgi:cell wall assembly regulator SMI1
VQKFTRPIMREIELGGERIVLTLAEEGITLRPVGSRATPRQVSWAAVLAAAVEGKEPGTEELTEAVAALRKPPGDRKPAKPKADAKGQSGEEPERLKPLLDRLERWLAAHRPRLFQALRLGANEVELHALQARLARELPQELRTLLAWRNGQGEEFAGRFEEDWLLMDTDRIAEAKAELDEGAVGNGESNGWRPEWIPFMDDDGGNYLLLDTSQTPPPVRAYWLGEPEPRTLAPSLTAWMEEFVKAVEAGQYEEDPERGTFLRREGKG